MRKQYANAQSIASTRGNPWLSKPAFPAVPSQASHFGEKATESQPGSGEAVDNWN